MRWDIEGGFVERGVAIQERVLALVWRNGRNISVNIASNPAEVLAG
jgi:hypothetical protein